MFKYRYAFTAVVFLLLAIFIWRTPLIFSNLSNLLSKKESTTEINVNLGNDETSTKLDKTYQPAANNFYQYETIEETIARLKRDVVVTGTITGTLGQESAIFQIEGMADRLFNINTQLMDGFIIKEITNSYVVLKNQTGNEAFSLYVQSGEEALPDSGQESIMVTH